MYNVKKVLTVVSGLIFLFFVHGNALAQMREGSHEFGGKGFSQGGFSHGGTAFSHHETTRPSNNTARPSNNVVSNNMAFNHNTTFSDSRSSNRDFDRDGDRDFRRRSHNRSFITFFGYDPFYYNPYGYPYYYSYEAAPTYNST
ncbi:MAG: hypothetical protein ACM3IL_01710, partial [Deltaproteobacteria bacterium]